MSEENRITLFNNLFRAVHKRWTKEGGPAPDGDSMIEKVITAHRDKIEKNCARVVEKEAGSADVAIVADVCILWHLIGIIHFWHANNWFNW